MPYNLHVMFVSVLARRLERNIKEILDEIGENKERLEKLLTGQRVLLAKELNESIRYNRLSNVVIDCYYLTETY